MSERCQFCGGDMSDAKDCPALVAQYLTAPERIAEWVRKQFNPKYVDRVVQDLVDVAAGNREGNRFEQEALVRIFPEWSRK